MNSQMLINCFKDKQKFYRSFYEVYRHGKNKMWVMHADAADSLSVNRTNSCMLISVHVGCETVQPRAPDTSLPIYGHCDHQLFFFKIEHLRV